MLIPNIADRVAQVVGSWRFISIQSSLLLLWIILNCTGQIHHWDEYPFILLNLALSFQAAYATPFILMSQNRQAVIDRADMRSDLESDLRSELEIAQLKTMILEIHESLDRIEQACSPR